MARPWNIRHNGRASADRGANAARARRECGHARGSEWREGASRCVCWETSRSRAAADAAATYRQFRARYPAFDVSDYLHRWIRSPDYVARILAGLAAAEQAATNDPAAI
jgi:hypothetical protein